MFLHEQDIQIKSTSLSGHNADFLVYFYEM